MTGERCFTFFSLLDWLEASVCLALFFGLVGCLFACCFFEEFLGLLHDENSSREEEWE